MKHKILFVALFIAFIQSLLLGQTAKPRKYWVEFTDKNQTPYCTCRPYDFLSARSIDRRAKAGIAVVENDLPVNPWYLDSLKFAGAKIHLASRWLNAATIITTDSAVLEKIASFDFVKSVSYIGPHLAYRNKPNPPIRARVPLGTYEKPDGGDGFFGYAVMQASVLNIPFLYHAGARGTGIWVAVMDGGFTNADIMPFFDSVAMQGRLFSAWDFVEHDAFVWEAANHGTSVLSVMAANLPGYFMGTAPNSHYFCIKTEDTGGEFPVEETNWIAGAEFADSLGADIINASLGYTGFNDTTLSHRFSELNGRSAIGSRGASIAANKGMIICNSAGNSGDEPWRYIGVPADAPGIVAVGAVTLDGEKASFSSFGPTADGRIKPDLASPGEMIVTAGGKGIELTYSSGTSVASPMLAGSIASLWSAYPEKTAKEILDAVYEAADNNKKPDNERGYGIPNFIKAWLTLGGFLAENTLNNARNGYFSFNRDNGTLGLLLFDENIDSEVALEMYDVLGHKISIGESKLHKNKISTVFIEGLVQLPRGTYYVKITGSKLSLPFLCLTF